MTTVLSESEWSRILPFLRAHPHVYVGQEHECRRFLEAVLWILRTGAQWREVPRERGHWNSVYKRFRDWARKGVFDEMLDHFGEQADTEWLCFDSTIIRAHMCAAGAAHSSGGQHAQDLGRSKGGFTTKIHIKVDSHGNPLRIELTQGQRHDSKGYDLLREPRDAQACCVLGDKAYDSNAIRADLQEIGVEAVIPSNKRRTKAIPYDEEVYKHRHVVECFINKIKWYRRVFTRYDKLTKVYRSFIIFASCLVWLR